MGTGGSEAREDGTQRRREKKSWNTAIIPLRYIYSSSRGSTAGEGKGEDQFKMERSRAKWRMKSQ
jgi:hypothetical protein